MAESCYFFDFDKNIMKVKVPFVLKNSKDGSTKEVSSEEYMLIKAQLGKKAPWKDWTDKPNEVFFRNYKDRPDTPIKDQPFIRQIQTTLNDVDPKVWQSPAWPMFVHACNEQRPLSLITARGHSDETVKAGFEILCGRLGIKTPNYLTIFNVTYGPTTDLLDPTGKLVDEFGNPETPQLKRVAILKSVDAAIEKYGIAPHHFGMSDDTELNIEFIADAMAECKKKYSSMRFFVISTNYAHKLKAEIFPFDMAVTGKQGLLTSNP